MSVPVDHEDLEELIRLRLLTGDDRVCVHDPDEAFPHPPAARTTPRPGNGSRTPPGPALTFFSVREVAEILRCHPGSVVRHIKKGRLLAVRPVHQWLVSEKDLVAFLKTKHSR